MILSGQRDPGSGAATFAARECRVSRGSNAARKARKTRVIGMKQPVIARDQAARVWKQALKITMANGCDRRFLC